jgi:hypothetical protein
MAVVTAIVVGEPEDAHKREALRVADGDVPVAASAQIAQHPDAADVSRSLRGRLAQVGVSATAVDEQTVALEARPLQHDPADQSIAGAVAVYRARSGCRGLWSTVLGDLNTP